MVSSPVRRGQVGDGKEQGADSPTTPRDAESKVRDGFRRHDTVLQITAKVDLWLTAQYNGSNHNKDGYLNI